MSISKNNLMFALFATIVPFGIYSEDQQSEKPQTSQFDLANSLKKAGDIYEKCSEKMKPYCNPIGMAGTAVAASVLKKWQLAAVVIGGTIIIFSENITEMIEKKMTLDTMKSNQDSKLELEKTNPTIDQSSNNSDQKILSSPKA